MTDAVWKTKRVTSSTSHTATVTTASHPISRGGISCATACTSNPISTNSEPLSRKEPSGHVQAAWRRDAAVLMRGLM